MILCLSIQILCPAFSINPLYYAKAIQIAKYTLLLKAILSRKLENFLKHFLFIVVVSTEWPKFPEHCVL